MGRRKFGLARAPNSCMITPALVGNEHGAKANEARVMALDVGTSGVRAALYDGGGREVPGTVARLTRSLSTTADGGAELDADEAVAQVVRTIDGLCARAGALTGIETSRVALIGVSCFWHSLVGVDDEGRAVTPVLGWADTRAGRAAEELRLELDERATHRRTGCRFHPSYWPAKLRWLRAERNDLYRGARRWMSFADYLALALCGEARTSVSMASGTGLFDVRACAWDEELLRHLGVGVERLPAVATAGGAGAELKIEYKRRWPQLARTRLLPAIGDGAANNVGAGCVTGERAALMVGTSGAMRVMWEGDAPAELPPALWCYRADWRRVVVGGALSDGGALRAWMSDALALGGDEAEVERALARMEPDAHGLTVLPFWLGERSTGWHHHARGAILGLTAHTGPVEILRAALEGVAYRFAHVGDSLNGFAPGAEIIASGGAVTASAVWPQIIADVLNRPVILSGVREASSRGAALLALEVAGEIKTVAETGAPRGRVYEPDAKRHARYGAGLARHQRLYEQLVADEEMARIIFDAPQCDES